MHIKEERPGGETEALKKSLAGDYLDSNQDCQALEVAKQRRIWFHELCERHEWTPGQIASAGPSDYGLNTGELIEHANTLVERHGWQPWEIKARLTHPSEVSA